MAKITARRLKWSICQLARFDVILEKHWKAVIHRSICDYFFDAQKKAASPEDVLPVTGRTNHSETLPTGQLSNIPWRRQGVKYTNNEAYFDVIEEIDAIIDRQGSTVFAEIQGYIDVCCKLSGMPDLTMTLVNPRLLDDVSFHPCVRFKRWENERVLSFVPPDGNFRLLSYHIATQNMVAIPIYVRHSIVLRGGTGSRLEMTVGPKQSMGKILEDVVVEMLMPKAVLNCNLVPSQGKCTFDPTSHLLQWTIGKIELGKPPNIKGTVGFAQSFIGMQTSVCQKGHGRRKFSELDGMFARLRHGRRKFSELDGMFARLRV
ncbi:adaptor complexe medium subunit family protein [Teladorsagia circumcincta]|uniref:Adaptor complexe medium subunit family protein n=1 Tax=Teladorsagia circumcincta TaxID=45464 RepID=A0A2G9UWC9_TELCI|nr:adaptor complexe medium subunit family protein [Teladorsagia circumcincta]